MFTQIVVFRARGDHVVDLIFQRLVEFCSNYSAEREAGGWEGENQISNSIVH